MAPFIGELPSLLGVTEEEIILFLDEWIKLHNEVKNLHKIEAGIVEVDMKKALEEMKTGYILASKSWKILSEILTPEILAGLKSLFYFARDKNFSESYIYTYELMKKIVMHE